MPPVGVYLGMDYPGPEKRRAKRIKKPLVLDIRRPSDPPEKEWAISTVKDLSVTGVSFRTDEEFKQGESLVVRITVLRNVPPIECKATVMRVQPLKDEYKYEIGLTYVGLTLHDTEWLARAVKSFSSDEDP